MVSQRTNSLRTADQILVLEQGRQVGLGRHEDLLRSSAIYQEIHQSQQQGGRIAMRQSSFKELVRLVLHQPLRMSLMLVGTLVQVLLTVYLPILIGQAVDAVLIANGQVLLGILGKMVMVILLNTLVQWYLPLVTNRLVYGMVADLREQVYVKLHQMPLSYLDRQSVGDLVARFSSDSEQLTNGLLMIFNQFFIGILTIFLTIFTMARLDLTMMLLVVALTPVSLLVARYIAKKSYGYYRQQTQARGRQSQLWKSPSVN